MIAAYIMPTSDQCRVRLTKSYVEKLPLNNLHPVYYRDSELHGFGLYVGKTKKSYFVEGRYKGANRRTVIGSHKLYSLETARSEAKRILLELSQGKDPKRTGYIPCEVTLDTAFNDYLHSRELKTTTLHDYDRIRKKDFADWIRLPINEITKNMVEHKHAQLGVKSHARANNAMRVLRAVFNYAMAKYEDIEGNSILTENPVSRLSKTRAWFKVRRRQSVIRAHQLGAWITSVLALPKTIRRRDACIGRDFLLLLLFTGLRKSEAAKLTKENVDLVGKMITIPDTKNEGDHVLPIPDFLVEILIPRHGKTGDHVFPGTADSDFFVEPRKQIAHVTKATNIKFTPHDLRRTFITVAESLDIPAYALKRLLNHRMKNDVTAGYIIADPERLRDPMNKICGYMLSKAGLTTADAIRTLGAIPRMPA